MLLAEAVVSSEAELGMDFQAPTCCWQNSFPVVAGLRHQFLAGGCPQLLQATLPCHVGFSNVATNFMASISSGTSANKTVLQISKHNHSLAMSCWSEESHRFCPHSTARNYTKAWTTRRWGSVGGTSDSVHHNLPSIPLIFSPFSNFYLFGSFVL